MLPTDRHLLTMLVCPLTGSALALSEDGSELISRSARIAYPIRDGIPVMVASEARPLGDVELKTNP